MLGASVLVGVTVIAAHAQNLQINLNDVTPSPLLSPSPFASDTQQAIAAANSADATLTGDIQTLGADSTKLQALMNGLTPQQQQLMQNPDATTQGLIQQAQAIQYYAAVAAADPAVGAIFGAIAHAMNDAFVANAQKAGDNPTVIANIATATTLSSQVATLSGNLFADQVNAVNANGAAQQLEGRDLQNLATTVQSGTGALSQSALGLVTSGNLQATLSSGLINLAQLNTAQLAVLGLTRNAAGNVVSNDGGSLISQDGGLLITNDGATLISNDGATFVKLTSLSVGQMAQLVATGGGNAVAISTGTDLTSVLAAASFAASQLISNDGGTLISNDGATLISNDGATLSALISNDGATLAAVANGIISHNGSTIISSSSPIISENGNGIISNNGTTVVSNDGGSVVSNDGGSVISNNGTTLGPIYGLASVNTPPPNSSPGRLGAAQQLANALPSQSPPPSASGPTPPPGQPSCPSPCASPTVGQSPTNGVPRLPRDLSKLTDQQLMALENQYYARVTAAQQNGSSAADIAQLKLNMDRLYLQQYTDDQTAAEKNGNTAGASGYQPTINALKQSIQSLGASLPPPPDGRYTFAELTTAASGASANPPQFVATGTALVAALLNGRQTPITVTVDPSKPYAGLTPAQVLFVASGNLSPADQVALSTVVSKYQNGTIGAADLENPAFAKAYGDLLASIPAQQRHEVAKGIDRDIRLKSSTASAGAPANARVTGAGSPGSTIKAVKEHAEAETPKRELRNEAPTHEHDASHEHEASHEHDASHEHEASHEHATKSETRVQRDVGKTNGSQEHAVQHTVHQAQSGPKPSMNHGPSAPTKPVTVNVPHPVIPPPPVIKTH